MISLVMKAGAGVPAGGSETRDILIIGAVVSAGFLVVATVGLGQRLGRANILNRVAEYAGRQLGMPGWAALPIIVAVLSMAIVYFGYMWDSAIHMNNGRDPGPFGNKSHYPMMLGLYGILAAGVLGVFLPKPGERPGRASIRVTRSWSVPVGSAMLLVCGNFAFLGFPLDEVWHRLFGQDVTIWGPTHVQMLSGAIMSIVGVALLFSEATGPDWRPLPDLQDRLPFLARILDAGRAQFLFRSVLMGMLLVGLTALLAEYDRGVPLFQLWFHPGLIAVFAALAFVAARVWSGRAGSALIAVVFYLVVRLLIGQIVGPVLGEGRGAFPLMLAEAAIVEIAAMAFIRRPLVFGAVSGFGIGTLGVLAELPWVNATFPISWTAPMLGEGFGSAIVLGISGGVLGALLGAGLAGKLSRRRVARTVTLLSLAAAAAVMVNGFILEQPPKVQATVQVTDVSERNGIRQSSLSVQFSDMTKLGDPMYVGVLAYQAGPPLVSQPLVSLGDGAYRTQGTVPIGGQWKTIIRINTGRVLGVVPVFLPEDLGVPAAEVSAPSEFTRPIAHKTTYLLREMKPDASKTLYYSCVAAVVVLIALFIALFCLGIARFARREDETVRPWVLEPAARE